MKFKTRHFLWLLPLQLLLVLFPTSVNSFTPKPLYKQQVVVILDDVPTIQKAGRFLYGKHDTSSHILMWNGTAEELEIAEWNTDSETYEGVQGSGQQLPIGPQKTFSWSDTLIQIVGSGDIDNKNSPEISRFSAEKLATVITGELTHGDVGRIDIIGYGTHEHTATSEPPTYLSQFMYTLKQLGRLNTAVTVRASLALLDHSGRELTGQLYLGTNTTDIEWNHMTQFDTWVGYFTGENYQLERLAPSTILQSPFFGVLPGGIEVHVTDYQKKSDDENPTAYAMNDETAFEWVDSVAQTTYQAIPNGRAPSVSRRVQFLLDTQEIRDISVTEIGSVADLLKELRYYGDKGPADSNTENHYRFGDWIVVMNEADFYVTVSGIVVSSTDSSVKRAKLENLLSDWHAIPVLYPGMQPSTGANFLTDVTSWINGESGAIGLEMENAYNAQCGVAMFLSEAIRSFHTHITNMMSLDLANHGYLTKEYFFSSHPMARRGTWQIHYTNTGKQKTGLALLQDKLARSGLFPDEDVQTVFDEIIHRISRISKSWLSHVDSNEIKGSRDLPPATKQQEYSLKDGLGLLAVLESIGSTPPASNTFLREYELHESFDRLLSSNISEPETGAIGTQVIDFSHIDDVTLPLHASIALVNDHAYVSDLISRELHLKQLHTGKVYQVVPNTIEVDDESDIVKFFVKEVANVSSELEQIVTEIKKFRLQSKALIEKFLSLSNKTKKFIPWLKKGEGLINAVKGISSSIHQLESGNLVEELKGAYHLGQNIYKIGDITGINKAAGEYIGKALKKLTDEASKSVESFANGVVKKTEGTVSSLIGKFKELKAKFAPIISAVEGIYNIYEDFKQHTTLGYINAAFDIAETVLSFFGPEAAPFEAALSLIQMGVDYFYTDISRELHALPPHASVGRIVVAVLKGIFEGIVDIIKQFLHNIDIFAVIGDAHKLDKQYDNDRRFLQELSDYRNYFEISRLNGSNVSEINFADGSESWNGGDITFRLGEDGHSTLTMEGVNSDGNPTHATEVINTPGVEDIVLGIGESHSVSFKTVTVKFLFFKVDSKRVISRVDGEKQTLYGTYYGNSQNNKFIAVQELTPQAEKNLGYNLHDYHYTLYGGGGNDTFYLGPQPTYVEGNEGSDAYFINSTSTFTEINSHAGDGQGDTMIINLNYDQLTAKREGLNLNLTSSNTHRIVIRNWFHDVTHQRMVFKTGDGVLFKVSATITEAVDLIAYALSGQGATKSGVYDARLPQYSEVATIAGSEHDDILYGNDLDNQLNGAGGNDRLVGGEGKDTYNVDLDKGVDIINNFALGGEVDTLVIGTRLDQLAFSSHEDSNDLFISRIESTEDESSTPSTGATISNWFLNETYRHLIVVTEDKAVVKVSSVKNSTVSYQSLIVNMSQIEEQLAEQGIPYSRKLDLNSDQKYSAVVTVFGTPYNDTIIGNGKDNYITGGQGLDYIEGREGADTYVVKEGDESTTILNCAKDTSMDTLLLAAKFDDIELLNISDSDLSLTGNDLEVILKNWFHSKECQHLLVRSADGVTFTLPNVTAMDLVKTAKSVDNSNLTTDVQLILSGKWATVERVTGSQADDSILGNSLDNYIDPGLGNSYLQGGNGSDTYVIRSTYGEDNIINNYAEDDLTDTILFLVPYLTIQIEFIGMDIRLTSLSGDGLVGVRIMDYNFHLQEHARHLVVTTSDGISFVLPVANDTTTSSNYKPIPISINMAQTTTGQHMHLTAYTDFTEVRTVYGSSRYQNTIIGNGQNNTLVGGVNADLIQGLDGGDILKGGDGNDVIEGGSGADTLVGGDGDDNLDGGEDNDIISPGSGTNQVDGGSGTDTVLYSGDASKEEGISLDLSTRTCIHDGNAQDTLNNIENAYGTEYDDVLQGDDKDNVLVGQGGSDYLAPGSGYDILNGGNGNDTYDLSTANGTVTIENYADDGTWDLVIMGYANLSHIWYEIVGHDVIIRAINVQHPIFYDGDMPAVVFKSFTVNSTYQHTTLEMADGSRVNLADFITDNPQTTPTAESPASTPVGLYVALGLLLLTLCVLLALVVLGVYKLRSKRTLKRYILL